jgi:uncharacterized protein
MRVEAIRFSSRTRFAAWIFFGMVSVGLGQIKTPIVKNGDCPTLTRKSQAMDAHFHNVVANNTLGQQPNTIQNPLTPQQSINCMEVPSGFTMELWASEADLGIKAVQAFNFDERGRMWAIETFDYPNEMSSSQIYDGHDRVIILEDTNGDRVADKLTEFVGGLNMPTSVLPVNEGVLVVVPPVVLLFKDANGDDKADNARGQTVLSGLRKFDTHGSASNLHYGLDNWYYAHNGYNPATVSGTGITSGSWRFKLGAAPKVEMYGATGNGNAWGLGFMEDGQAFSSSANGAHSHHVVIPGIGTSGTTTISAYGQGIVNNLTRDINQWETYNGSNPGFTSASNHDIYTSRLFPKEYWNRAAFICEGTSHVVAQDFLTANNSSWRATRNTAAPNLITSKDAWVAPVMAKTGPDGAVWVLDWNNYLFLHNPANPSGAGGAWIHPLRTKTTNRIYRVVPTAKLNQLEPILDLRTATVPQLVRTFGNPNLEWRLQAQRLLLAKGASSSLLTELEWALSSRMKDEVDMDPWIVHALWTLHGLGELEANPSKWNPILRNLLLHPAAGARANVMKVMPTSAVSAQAIKEQCRANDANPQVRLQAFLALARMPAATGGPAQTNFRTTDSWATTAFNRAGSAKLTEGNPTGCPDLLPVGGPPTVGVQAGNGQALPKGDLRFVTGKDGYLHPLPNGRLAAGVLSVFNTSGRRVGRLRYDGRQWSSPALTGLREAFHYYVYEANNGDRYEGRILLPGI